MGSRGPARPRLRQEQDDLVALVRSSLTNSAITPLPWCSPASSSLGLRLSATKGAHHISRLGLALLAIVYLLCLTLLVVYKHALSFHNTLPSHTHFNSLSISPRHPVVYPALRSKEKNPHTMDHRHISIPESNVRGCTESPYRGPPIPFGPPTERPRIDLSKLKLPKDHLTQLPKPGHCYVREKKTSNPNGKSSQETESAPNPYARSYQKTESDRSLRASRRAAARRQTKTTRSASPECGPKQTVPEGELPSQNPPGRETAARSLWITITLKEH